VTDWDTISFEFKNYDVGGKDFTLTYTDTHVSLNDKGIAFSDLRATRFAVYPPFKSRGWTFWLELLSHSKEKIKVEFHCGRLMKQNFEQRMALWQNIMYVNRERVLQPMVVAAVDQIRNGGIYSVGRIGVLSEGVSLRVRRLLLFNRQVFIPWQNVLKREQDDWLHVSSSAERSVAASCSPMVWNAVVLRSLLDYLWQDGRLAELKPPLSSKGS
jgi:hypothetical protein